MGLFHEHVPPPLDARHHVQRMELGGVGDEDHVGRFDDLAVGVEAGETALVRHVHLLGKLQAQGRAFLLDPVEQQIAHRGNPDPLVGFHRIDGRGLATPAAANDAHPDDVAAGHISRGHRRRGGGAEKSPA